MRFSWGSLDRIQSTLTPALSRREREEGACYFFMFGHSQPFAQSLQHSHSQLQLGQSLQQSLLQQALLFLQHEAVSVTAAFWPAMPAATRPVARIRPLNSLVIILGFTFLELECVGGTP